VRCQTLRPSFLPSLALIGRRELAFPVCLLRSCVITRGCVCACVCVRTQLMERILEDVSYAAGDADGEVGPGSE
jgi:hypothetical protein